LSDHALVEYVIDTGDAESLYKSMYNLSVNELSIFRDNLEELLKKGYIQRLISSAGASILFIFKKNRDFWIYVDYRRFNKITKKNRYLFPFIEETLDRLQETIVFTKLDVRDTYHRIRIRKGDK